MSDIVHRIGIEHASPTQVDDALTTLDGLSGWWAEQTSGTTDLEQLVETGVDAPTHATSTSATGNDATQRVAPTKGKLGPR